MIFVLGANRLQPVEGFHFREECVFTHPPGTDLDVFCISFIPDGELISQYVMSLR